MELGEKLLRARQEAGLSQRQLCGDVITRNMLSQIEHGTAKPSMETLRYLAARLEKPMSFFLEEDVVLSPNQELMTQVRAMWEGGKYGEVWLSLKAFRHPDPTLEWEWNHCSFLSALESAKTALKDGKHLYARQLLEEAEQFRHRSPELERQRLLLLAAIPGGNLTEVVQKLPPVDEELMIRAEAAMTEGNRNRAQALLSAVEDRTGGKWNLLQGRVLMQQAAFEQASQYLQKAEQEYPTVCMPLLETCFRELGDFQRAYEYACRQR